MEWIKAEDAPDRIPRGAMVLFSKPEWLHPKVQFFDPDYDRSENACGGFFFAKFSWPAGPKYDN